MALWLKIIGWTVLTYAVYCTFLFVIQRQMIFPRGLMGDMPGVALQDPAKEKIWLAVDGSRIESWFLPPAGRVAGRRAPVLIFAHGNAELIDHCISELTPLTRLGLGVLLVEYPGYGRSGGSPSQKSITAAFVSAYDMLVGRPDVDPRKIVLYGRSLGGGAVCALATQRPAAALILVSSFTSVRAMATRYLVPGFLVRDPFDNLAVVKDYRGPVLVMHGRYDEVIPFRHGLALHRSARNARLLAYDCGHNDCPPDLGLFWQEVAAFLREAGIIS